VQKWDFGSFLSERLTSTEPLSITYEPVGEFAWKLQFEVDGAYVVGFLHFSPEEPEESTIAVLSASVGVMMPLSARRWLSRQIKKYVPGGSDPLAIIERSGELDVVTVMRIEMPDELVKAIESESRSAADELLRATKEALEILMQDWQAAYKLVVQYQQVN